MSEASKSLSLEPGQSIGSNCSDTRDLKRGKGDLQIDEERKTNNLIEA